jgi:hypothetical protein
LPLNKVKGLTVEAARKIGSTEVAKEISLTHVKCTFLRDVTG